MTSADIAQVTQATVDAWMTTFDAVLSHKVGLDLFRQLPEIARSPVGVGRRIAVLTALQTTGTHARCAGSIELRRNV